MTEYELQWIVQRDVCFTNPIELESTVLYLKTVPWNIRLINNNQVIQFVLRSPITNGLPAKPFRQNCIQCININGILLQCVDSAYKTAAVGQYVQYFFAPIRTSLYELTCQYTLPFKIIISFDLIRMQATVPLYKRFNQFLQPSPAQIEPAPAKKEPAPAKKEPAPAKKEPAPAKKELVPVKQQPVPEKKEPVPVKIKAMAVPHNKLPSTQTLSATKVYVFAAENCNSQVILQDYGKLLNDHRHCDMTLLVKDHRFRCHKAILAVRCALLMDLIELEGNGTEFSLSDIDVETAADLLYYIYAGRAPNIDKTADRLLVFAEKFDLNALQLRCNEALKLQLNFEMALKMLRLDHDDNGRKDFDDDSKQTALEFVRKNKRPLIQCHKFKDEMTKNPDFFFDLMSQIV